MNPPSMLRVGHGKAPGLKIKDSHRETLKKGRIIYGD